MATRPSDAMSNPIISAVAVGGRLGATFSRGLTAEFKTFVAHDTVVAPGMPSFARAPHWIRISFNRTLEISAGWIAELMRTSSS